MFELKRLSKDAIPAALDKALRYRLLNEPAEAEWSSPEKVDAASAADCWLV